MFSRIITHFSLLALLTQIFHISYIGILIGLQSERAFAQALDTATQNSVLSGISLPTYDKNTGAATVGGAQLEQKELFGMDVQRVGNEGQFDADNAYQSEERLNQSAVRTRDRIKSNVVGQESDFDVAAYNTLRESRGNTTKMNSEDTIMKDSDKIFRDLADQLADPDSDFFSECTTKKNVFDVNKEYIGLVEHECSEPDRTNLAKCEIRRHVDYPIEKISGTGEIKFINDTTFDLIIGKETDNYYSGQGACNLIPVHIEIKIRDDVIVESAHLEEIWIDDITEITLNNEILYGLYWQGNTTMPRYSHEYGCEYGTSRYFSPHTNVTQHFEKARASHAGKVKFHMLLGVADGGEGKARVRIKTRNPVTPKEHIEQYPVGCASQVGYVQPKDTCDVFGKPGDAIYINPQCDNPLTFGNGQVGQMCSFSGWSCVKSGYHHSSYDNYVSALPITLPGVTTDPKKCRIVNASAYQCDPLPDTQICGAINYPDDTTIVCKSFKDFNASIPDRCEPYRDNPDCKLIKSEPSFVDPISGKPYVSDSTYECHTYTSNDYSYTLEEDICTGSMKCVAGDCQFADKETNDDFGEAMAVFGMLDDIKRNMDCENPDDISTCQVFKGEPSYCGVEKTGMGMNCCTLSAGQVTVFDYIRGVSLQHSMEQAMIGLQEAAIAAGPANNPAAWGSWANKFPTPVTDTVTYVTDAFSSGWDMVVRNVTGDIAKEVAGDVVTDQVKDLTVDAAMEAIKQEVYKAIINAMPEAVANVVFAPAVGSGTATAAIANGQAVGLNPAVAGAMSALMWAYFAYQMIKLAITIVSECDDSEMAMGMKLDQQQCIYDSSSCHKDTPFGCLVERNYYCCYPSPLGRIIMEQAAPQVGLDLDPQNNQCDGLTIQQIAELDWDEIDLSEWENMLLASGIGVDHNDLNLDTLSSQPWMPNNAHALNPVELNKERFEESNVAENIKENHDAAFPDNLDCSVYPRPPACDSPLNIVD